MTSYTTDQVWPRIPDYRYRLVELDDDGSQTVLGACPEPGGIGDMIVTFAAEEGPLGRIGILDVLPDGEPSPTGRWLANPYARGGTP